MKLNKIHHMAVICSDYERSKRFYADVLKQALLDFDGTLIVVSHDRDFLDGLVSKVYEFGHGRVREHLCGIYEFLESKKMESLQELERNRVKPGKA